MKLLVTVGSGMWFLTCKGIHVSNKGNLILLLHIAIMTCKRQPFTLRPPLSKKVLPVCRVGQKTASREVGNFFFSNFIFNKLEYTGGGSKKKTLFENMKKNNSRRPFLAHSAAGQGTTFYLRVALCSLRWTCSLEFLWNLLCSDSVQN